MNFTNIFFTVSVIVLLICLNIVIFNKKALRKVKVKLSIICSLVSLLCFLSMLFEDNPFSWVFILLLIPIVLYARKIHLMVKDKNGMFNFIGLKLNRTGQLIIEDGDTAKMKRTINRMSAKKYARYKKMADSRMQHLTKEKINQIQKRYDKYFRN